MNMKDLFENGTMSYLKEVGIVSPTVFRYKELNDALEQVKKSQQVCKTQAVSLVADKSKVGEKIVWKAARMMNK